MRNTTRRTIRYLAAAAAGVTAILYVLIGFEVIYIGESSSGGTPDLLAFGLMVGGAFAVIALLMMLVGRRLVWIPVAAFNIVVIVGYFAAAELREPSFAPWGLVVKAVQVAILAAVVYLVVRGPESKVESRQASPLATAGRT
jgi:hypothetical protein